MGLLDNKTRLLGDDLRKEIIPGSKVKIVASFFSIYAYETLKKELESIEELEFIFPSPTFVSDGIKGTVKKEAKEFYIPKQIRESSLYGTEFEIRLRNQLTQRVIAKECAEWIKKKVKFKSNITPRGLQNFIHVDNNSKKIAYTPIEGFTAVDLGYEQNNMYFQGIMKQEDDKQFLRVILKYIESQKTYKDSSHGGIISETYEEIIENIEQILSLKNSIISLDKEDFEKDKNIYFHVKYSIKKLKDFKMSINYDVISKASCLLLNITTNRDVLLSELEIVLKEIRLSIDSDTDIIYGYTIDSSINEILVDIFLGKKSEHSPNIS